MGGFEVVMILKVLVLGDTVNSVEENAKKSAKQQNQKPQTRILRLRYLPRSFKPKQKKKRHQNYRASHCNLANILGMISYQMKNSIKARILWGKPKRLALFSARQ